MDKQMMAIIGVVFSLLLLWSCAYTIKETDRALLIEFGEIKKPELKAGLGWKLPWQDVVRFDARVQVMDTRPTEYLTQEKKILVVDAFVVYRIADNQQFYTATGGGQMARARDLLAQRAIDGLKNKVSQRTLTEVVSGKRDEMMVELTGDLAARTMSELGVEVIDVRVKRADYPEAALNSIFQRMSTEREREAREHRSEGKEEAELIRAEADKQRVVLLATAFRDAQRIRGEGDGKAAGIYAGAYSKDPEFFNFWRSMLAYQETFTGPENVLVVQPGNDFFRQMQGR